MHGSSSYVFHLHVFVSEEKLDTVHGLPWSEKNCNWFQSSSVLSIHTLFHICYDIYTFFDVLSSIFYCKTHKTVNTRKIILWNVIVLLENNQ